MPCSRSKGSRGLPGLSGLRCSQPWARAKGALRWSARPGRGSDGPRASPLEGLPPGGPLRNSCLRLGSSQSRKARCPKESKRALESPRGSLRSLRVGGGRLGRYRSLRTSRAALGWSEGCRSGRRSRMLGNRFSHGQLRGEGFNRLHS